MNGKITLTLTKLNLETYQILVEDTGIGIKSEN
jgi:hypothetical protein